MSAPRDTVPGMGHSHTNYPEHVTIEAAAAAMRHVRALLGEAQAAHEIVRAQAVLGLHRNGMSVRDIATALELSRSVVGREIRTPDRGWARSPRSQHPDRFIDHAWGER